MLLLKPVRQAVSSSTTSTSKDALLSPKSSSKRRSKNSRLQWLCCSAPAAADDLAEDPCQPQQQYQDGTTAQESETVLSKDPVQTPYSAASILHHKQQQQQLVLIGADHTLPAPSPDATNTQCTPTSWQQQQQQQQQQKQGMGPAQAGIHQCGSSIEAYTPSGSTASGARLAKAASCSLVPLTPHSLSTANVLFGSFSQGYTRSKGGKQQDTKDSPSELHSDLQQATKALYSSSSSGGGSASSSQQPARTAASSSSTPALQQQQQQQLPDAARILPTIADIGLPGPVAASQQHQQQQQLLLPQPQEGTDLAEVPDSTLAAAAGAPVVLALPTKHSITVSSSCSCQATQCTTSSVAGWSEVLLPATAIAPATAATASLPAATADPAAAATAPEDAPLEPLAHPAAAAAAADAADDVDILSLLPNLAAKLRKLESGLSFRMLQPELSTSLKASDSFPPDSATGASCCTTPAFKSGSFVLNASDSGSATGPVSRRSTPFGVLPLSLSRLSPSGLARALNPSGDQTLQTPADQTTALPATIPEHSSVSDGSNAVSTSAAVAAAFAADAAAVQDLVEAAAAAPPAPKPHHSRSKSAVPLTTAPEPPTSPTLGLQDASIHTTEAASLPPTAVLAEVPPTTPGGGSSSSSPAQLPAGRVTRTLSVSSSPFAQVDLQQAVTASLLAQQQPKAVPLHSTPADLAADSAAAAAAASRHAGSTPTSGFGAGSSTYRNLAALQQAYQQQQQQQQQQVMQVSVASAPLYTPMPGNSSSVGMRPSLTSKLSWASSVTGVTGVTAGPTAPEPQAQVFAVLDLTGMTTGTVGAAAAAAAAAEGAAATGTVTFRTEEGEADDSVPRVLRPSKSFSTLSQLKRGNSNSSSSGGSSSFGRVESFGVNWGGKGAKPGSRAKGIFSLGRVKSAVAVLGGLSRMQSLPARRLKSAPETSRAPDAAAGAGSRMGSGQSSSNGSSDGSLAAMEAAPALSTPISAAGSNISVKPAVAAAAAVSGNPVRCVQTQPVTPPQQQQGNLLSPNPSRQLAGLPPLPRPPSSFSLDQAAAAAAAGSSAAEGPFALQQQAALDASILAAAGTPLANSSSSSGGTPGGSSSLLLSSTQHSSTWRLSGSISYAPMGIYQLPETRSYGASSIGQLSSSGSSHGTNGSLMSLAVTRMHSAAAASASHSCGNLPSIASGGSSGSLTSGLSNPRGSVTAGLASQQSGSMPTLSSLDSGGIPASLASSSKSSSEVARAFAEAFLAALSAGNTKWASEAAVGDLLADAAKMVGLDKQLYVGKTAIIRRLNGGMEQLVKMAQATATDSSSSSSNASPGDATAATAAGSSGSIASLAKQLPKPQLTVSCPDPKGKPSVVEAVYSFRWGIRKFTMRDEFIVRGGQVLRLRRSRG